jgi:secreted trypsin-like serine protease
MHVSLPLVSNATCQIAYGNSITSRMICAGVPAGGKDSCWGDSGGPLFAYFPEARAGIQTGIVSWGEDCGLPGYYGVYTRISNPDIRTFIRQKAGV